MKRFNRLSTATLGLIALGACSEQTPVTSPRPADPLFAAAVNASSGVNVVLKGPITEAIVADLSRIGPVLDQIPQINALTMKASAKELEAIRAKPYVAAAEVDSEIQRDPLPSLAATTDFSAGVSSWDQDAIGVTTAPGSAARNVGFTGSGVYVLILDTGLLSSWRQYFPSERVSTQLARSFGGGGGVMGTVSSQPNKWEQDTDSHGTHVTSTVLGFRHPSAGVVNGTAPGSTVVPVKVLNQNGSGWWSVIARGIVYAGDLRAAGGALAAKPVVVNMSLSGGRSVLIESAINYAIGKGVIIVAAAGNGGNNGMGHPGAFAPVISVAAYGWTKQWRSCSGPAAVTSTWWRVCDVAEPTNAADFHIATFSARERQDRGAPQQLDVAAPGDWTVGPYQINNGQLGWFFLGGTSMASPHVAGIAALMLEKNSSLGQAQVEAILKNTAIPLAVGCGHTGEPACSRTNVFDINRGVPVTISWLANATGAGMVDAVAALNAVP